jgi:uncharacterized protein (DUF433 family)
MMGTPLQVAHIELTENDFGGVKRSVAGTRIRVQDVVAAYVFGESSVDWIAENFGISLAQVHAALSYYYDNKELIDQEIAEGDAYAERVAINAREYFDELARKSGS